MFTALCIIGVMNLRWKIWMIQIGHQYDRRVAQWEKENAGR